MKERPKPEELIKEGILNSQSRPLSVSSWVPRTRPRRPSPERDQRRVMADRLPLVVSLTTEDEDPTSPV